MYPFTCICHTLFIAHNRPRIANCDTEKYIRYYSISLTYIILYMFIYCYSFYNTNLLVRVSHIYFSVPLCTNNVHFVYKALVTLLKSFFVAMVTYFLPCYRHRILWLLMHWLGLGQHTVAGHQFCTHQPNHRDHPRSQTDQKLP